MVETAVKPSHRLNFHGFESYSNMRDLAIAIDDIDEGVDNDVDAQDGCISSQLTLCVTTWSINHGCRCGFV